MKITLKQIINLARYPIAAFIIMKIFLFQVLHQMEVGWHFCVNKECGLNELFFWIELTLIATCFIGVFILYFDGDFDEYLSKEFTIPFFRKSEIKTKGQELGDFITKHVKDITNDKRY